MNVLLAKQITPDRSFPWYDDYSKHKSLCKIYSDGSCYVAHRLEERPSEKRPRSYARMPIDDLFDQLHLEAIRSNIPKSARAKYILAGLWEQYPERKDLPEFVEDKLQRAYRNLCARKKRFRRKAFLHPWNYFVTFTYDDELHDEDSFKKHLRKSLANLHTRRGWRYMGVFERAPDTGRLHFHAIAYVPEGEMPGKIYERKDWSTREKRMQVTHPNTLFEKKLGRNDFEPISEIAVQRGNTMNYLLKYLEKSEERILYSRGIPTEFYKEIDDSDVICEMQDFVTKYILFDDVLDYDVDVVHTKAPPVLQIPLSDPPLPS